MTLGASLQDKEFKRGILYSTFLNDFSLMVETSGCHTIQRNNSANKRSLWDSHEVLRCIHQGVVVPQSVPKRYRLHG
jgi:hypothetical protein